MTQYVKLLIFFPINTSERTLVEMKIAAIEPMIIKEDPEEFSFDFQLDDLNDEFSKVSEVQSSLAEESLENAFDRPKEEAAQRLSDFINNYKEKLVQKELNETNPKLRRAIQAYNYLDTLEFHSTQIAAYLKKVA
ncbi:MAG: hypothetical protein KDD50_04850 [Bdellovibrionales bacterium]|nr:hypothetical protein [Bdellovibrionales bacterium]